MHATTRRPRVTPTAEQEQRAFERLRQPGWPRSLDAAKADHVRATLIHACALAIARDALRLQQPDAKQRAANDYPATEAD